MFPHVANLPLGLLRFAALLTCLFVLTGPAAAVTITQRWDNGGGNGQWETATNWHEDTAPNTLPDNDDVADIGSTFTANISSAQTIGELQVARPSSSPSYLPGTSTLNILPGASLITTGSNGNRIGRAVQAGQLAGSSLGVVNQTGGLLQMTAGTNGLRLSQGDSGIVADSYYRISGGSVRGGATNGSMTAPLQIGNNSNTYNRAEFHIVGSGVTEARFEDVRIQDSPTGANTILHFSLDAGGVTPLIAEDEMRFTGPNNNQLVIDLIGLAPQTDILLISADRLATPSGSPAPSEEFTGRPEGSPVTASYGPLRDRYTYNWTIDYQDDPGDDAVLDAYVYLRFVSRTHSVPEPASLLLVAICGAALALLRRRD